MKIIIGIVAYAFIGCIVAGYQADDNTEPPEIMLYITFWIYVFKKALIFFQHTKQAKLMIIVLLLICFFGIEGTSDSTITTHRGLFMMMMIGLMLSEMKNKIANSKS